MELDRNGLLKLYKTMATIRHFEERGIPETGHADVCLSTFFSRSRSSTNRNVREP
ncbi:MAG: hypothetical protein CM1200mP27_05800 [Chloroflexota bacterium]|nr:MAG: hypothetical protein CM1200mP27_05800 [Chloroflexota bacterium]